jgi:hypothetical protein
MLILFDHSTPAPLRYALTGQNLTQRTIAIVVLKNAQWPVLHRYVERVLQAVNACKPGIYTEVEIPLQ